jgi:uncharacterized radical SAM superfamily Fe-S cluster-containing enzyme
MGSQNEPCLAVIDITNRCNFKCPVCFAEAKGEGSHYFLEMEVVVKMLKALLNRPVPCRSVQFSGGEPTLHPDFPKILSTARDLGFTHLQVATNGSRFVDPDYAKLCEESGLHTLYLAVRRHERRRLSEDARPATAGQEDRRRAQRSSRRTCGWCWCRPS